jgi:RHS repeat-associated protein
VLRTFIYDTNSLDGTFTSYGAGRLVAVQNAQFTPGSSNPTEFTEMYSYTIAGQPNKKRLQTNLTATAYPYPVYTANLDAAYTYDTEGKMTSVSYPNAGPTYTYSFDSMSRPTGLTDQNNYAAVSSVQYAPSNQMLSLNYFGVSESRTYNTLMQLTNITIPGQLNLTYNYPTGTNNGKISSQSDAISGETVTYAYDSLNRLLSASGSGWNQSFGYDGFGNLVSKTGSNSPPLSISVGATTNQIQGVSGLSYDNNGNELYGGVAYDAENRVLTAPGVQYAYDSRNKRVWKGTFSGSTLTAQEAYFYGVDGQKLGSYSLTLNGTQITATTTQTAVFFGSKRVAVNGVAFGQDRLGSNAAGKFFPYGEDRGTPISNDQVKYATYTRDSATGLDYADQRYYSNQFARFMTPDPYQGSSGGPSDPNDPKSWNRYAYVLGDPINLTDHLGLYEDGDGEEDYEAPALGEQADGVGGVGGFNGPCTDGMVLGPSGCYYSSDTTFNSQSTGTPPPDPQGPDPGDSPPVPVPVPPGQPVPPWVFVPNPNPTPGQRPGRWKPAQPIPGQSQPCASWDPKCKHWDVDDGRGNRKRYLPGGGEVDHNGRPVTYITIGTIGVVLYWIISEGSRIAFPPRNLIPIP